MKTIFLILFTFVIFNLQAQSYTDVPTYTRKNAIIGASILGATFITMEIKGGNMTYLGRSTVAMSGIAISAGYSIYKASDLSRKVKRYFKLKRNKKINNEYLICEK